MTPQFFVVARVVGSPGAFPKWVERLVPLCEVSATEPQGTSYYWAQDLDGEPDTLWGLEGYSHAVGFFLGHPSSDIFKREMALVDKDKLLKTQQGLGSPDYDLHHYDLEGGWLTLPNDVDKDSKTSHVVLYHFWANDGMRGSIMERLIKYSEDVKTGQENTPVVVQSCVVLKECVYKHGNLTTLWLRTKTRKDYADLESSALWKSLQLSLESKINKSEVHQARAFNGHIDQKPSFQE